MYFTPKQGNITLGKVEGIKKKGAHALGKKGSRAKAVGGLMTQSMHPHIYG